MTLQGALNSPFLFIRGSIILITILYTHPAPFIYRTQKDFTSVVSSLDPFQRLENGDSHLDKQEILSQLFKNNGVCTFFSTLSHVSTGTTVTGLFSEMPIAMYCPRVNGSCPHWLEFSCSWQLSSVVWDSFFRAENRDSLLGQWVYNATLYPQSLQQFLFIRIQYICCCCFIFVP